MANVVIMPKQGQSVESCIISEFKVKVGDTVTEGQNLMVLEAMKMENEILSPKAGKVVQVAISKGSTVATGDLLAVIG